MTTPLERLYASKGVLTDDVKRVLRAGALNAAKRAEPKIRDDNLEFAIKMNEQVRKDPKKAEEYAGHLIEARKGYADELKSLIEAMPLPTPEQLATPKFWGRAEWASLTAEAFAFPKKPTPKQIDAACKRVSSLKYMLPCGKCRTHWRQNLKKHPLRPVLEAEGGAGFRKWIVDMHNRVNRDNKKPEMAFGHVCKRYDENASAYKISTVVLASTLGVMALILVVVSARLSAYVSRYGCHKRRSRVAGGETPTLVSP